MASKAIERRSPGRPPVAYDPGIAELICETIATSTLGLRAICDSNSALPSDPTIRKWLRSNTDFAAAYALAREQQMDNMADEIIDISDQDNADITLVKDGKTGETRLVINGEAIQRSKVRIDTRRFVMAKLAPRIYGDKLDVTSGGAALAPPNSIIIDARVRTIMLLAEQRRSALKLLDE